MMSESKSQEMPTAAEPAAAGRLRDIQHGDQPALPAEQATFMAALRQHGSVPRAANVTGISPSVAYAWLEDDACFATAWRELVASHLEELAESFTRRALSGAGATDLRAAAVLLEGISTPEYREGALTAHASPVQAIRFTIPLADGINPILPPEED